MYYSDNKYEMSANHLQSGLPHGTASKDSGATATPLEKNRNILLLADDLTGACDSGLEFLKTGCSVSVRFPPPEADLPVTAADVTAISTATRNLTADEATNRLQRLTQLQHSSTPTLFQKVDSAGRGNAGAEMLAIMQMSGRDGVVYAPAFPAAGRTVSQGVLRITDVSGQDNELALLSLIPGHARNRAAHIPVGSESELRQSMLQAHNQHKDIWLCDALQQDDLDRVVLAASALPMRLLWSGSAGLARAVAKLTSANGATAIPTQRSASPSGCTVVFCGTTHPVTLLQMDRLAPHAQALALDGSESLATWACGVISLDWATTTEQSVRSFWERHHQSGRSPIRSLVLTGGDTAAFVLSALNATSLRLGGEVEPGIPWGDVDDGLAEGCTVVTKSGGFGTELSLKNAIDFCQKVHA